MAATQEFAYGWVTPALAYGVSVLGSLLGLVCTGRARQGRTRGGRAGWLALAAISIGGTGIWLMHFLAMIGFSADGTDVRFTVGPTVVSALLAIAVVGVGLAILGTGPARAYRVFAGGVFTGLGVAGMHYTGMTAMRVQGTISYDPTLVALSIVIAIVAATAALWFTIVARNLLVITGAALIMGVAVNGMHYVGMRALRVKLDHAHTGAEGIDLTMALPIIAGLAGAIVVVLLYATLSIPTEEERMPAMGPGSAGSGGTPEGSAWTPQTPLAASAPGRRATVDTGAHRAPASSTEVRRYRS